MSRIILGCAVALLLCFSLKAQAQEDKTLTFTPLTAIDTISVGKMDNYIKQVPITGNDIMLAMPRYGYVYRLLQKYGPKSWIVYELPQSFSDTADCEIKGQFIIYDHAFGTTTSTTTWSTDNAIIIDAKQHGSLLVECDYEFQGLEQAPPPRRKNESHKHYAKRVEALRPEGITECEGGVSIDGSILTVWRNCTIGGKKVSPVPKPNDNDDWQMLQDVGTYQYKNGVFYKITTAPAKSTKASTGPGKSKKS